MKLRKYIRKYMTVFLLLCLLFTVNVVPIYAITASGGSTGSSGGSYVPTARSTFPLTVGFGYKIIPGDGQSPTMVFCNDFGGFGQELQSATVGQDYYQFKYPVAVGEDYDQNGKGVYYYDYDDVTTSAYSIPYTDGSYTSTYYFGYQKMRLHNSAFFSDPYDPTLNFMNNRYDTQQCITFKARDVVYNTHYLYGMNNEYYTDPLQAMMPSMIMFNNDNIAGFESDNAYYVYHYEWSVKFIDAYGMSYSYSGGWYHNTRDDPQKVVPLIPLNIMQRMAAFGNSIIIDDFTGVLSATYYERPTSNVLNGVWELKTPNRSEALFGVTHSGPLNTAACNVTLSSGAPYTGLECTYQQYYDTVTDSTSTGCFITNGDWNNTIGFASMGSPSGAFDYQYYGSQRITISDWDYANNANTQWFGYLNENYNQISEGAPDPNQSSSQYVQKGLAGQGLTLDLYYPLFNGDNVVNTGSEIYKQYYDYFGFPYFAKYVEEYGTRNPVVDDWPIQEGVDFSSWLVGAVGGFLGFELWPGFSLVNILSVCIAIPLLLWILKLFAGG